MRHRHGNAFDCLIAAHGLVFRALTVSLAGERLVAQNAEPFLFEPNGVGWEINRLG